MFNADDNSVYVSNGPAAGWVEIASGFSGPIHITDPTPSTSCTTGSITTLGGVGIAGNLNVCGTLAVAGGSTLSGQVAIVNTTPSTDPITGALVVAGGVGIGGDLNVGGTVQATQLATLGLPVVVSGAAQPTSGLVLTTTGTGQTASWQDAGSVIGVLQVPNGGTGDSTLTANGVLVGNGTSPVSTSKQAPSGSFVGTTDTQVLTNKTITGTTNTVRATQLATSGTDVTLGSAAPTTGQVLTATSATAANWQTPSSGVPPAIYSVLASGTMSISSNSLTPVTIWTGSVDENVGGITQNTGTGIFTIPTTGFYMFQVDQIWAANATGARQIQITFSSQANQIVSSAGATFATYDTLVTFMPITGGAIGGISVLQNSGGLLSWGVVGSQQPRFTIMRVA